MRVTRKILWQALALLVILLSELLGLYAARLREEVKAQEAAQLQRLYQVFLAHAVDPLGAGRASAPARLAGLKDLTGADWQLLAPSGAPGAFALLAGTLGEAPRGSDQAHRQAWSGTPAVDYTALDGRAYAVYSAPVTGTNGAPAGVVDIFFDRAPLLKRQQDHLLSAAGLLLVAAVAFWGGLAFILNRALRPVETLMTAANAIAAGNLEYKLPLMEPDEFGSLAGAIERMTIQMRSMISTLEQRVADRTRELEATIQVSRRVSTLLELDRLVKEVVDQLKYSFNFYHSHIYLYDETQEYLVMAGGTGEPGRIMLEQGHRIPKGKGLVGRAAQTNTTVLVPDVSKDPGWLPNPLLPETRCEVAIPIAVGDTVFGVLDVQHNVETGLIDQDVTLLQAIADQVALAVQNAKAYTQLQREAEREAQVAWLAREIRSTVAVEDALKVAVRELGHTLGVPQVRVRLVPKANDQVLLAEHGD